MKIPLYIEKEDAEDCPYGCQFRDGDNQLCRLFNQGFDNNEYTLETSACSACNEYYRENKT